MKTAILGAVLATAGVTGAFADNNQTSDKVVIDLAQSGNLLTPHGVFTGR